MKKLITKYWGLVLVVILLSSLFVVGAPASAANYAWTTSASIPGTALGPLGVLKPAAGFGIINVAQSGSTIYAIGADGALTQYLYKSADGGATWVRQTTVVPTGTYKNIVVSPDDPNFVAVVSNNGTVNCDYVWLSTLGGSYFSQLTLSAVASTINSITISPLTSARYIVIGGSNGAGTAGVASWTMGLVSPSWTSLSVTSGSTAATNVLAVAFSPSFSADTGLLVVTTNATGTILNCFSYNIAGLVPANGWNTAGMYFPRTILLGVTNADQVTLTLDNNLYLGDPSTQNGFIAVADTGTPASGGLYRIEPSTLITQQLGGTTAYQAGSAAWDGTNLIVAPYQTVAGAITIQRSANALTAIPTFLPSSAVKTPGTGTLPTVIFNNGVAFCFSRGQNSAVAKSTDLGKSFNGIALVNSDFTNIKDFWVSPNGSVKYVVTFDTVDVNLWVNNAGVWQRIFVLASPLAAQQDWLVRADADTPATVFLGNKGATLMYKSIDSGASWTIRGASAAIADFAVQDANIVYMVNNANATIYKSTTGAFTWTAITSSFLSLIGGAGVGYSVTLLGDNSVLVGTSTGGVAYSNDGATFTSLWNATDAPVAGNTVVTATGTKTGDTIFAGTTGGTIGKWVIGTSTSWGIAAGNTYAKPVTGIGYANGILYAIDDTNNVTYRWITPLTYGVSGAWLSDTQTMSATSVTDQTVIVNALTMAGNVLYARDTDATITAVDDIITYSDPLVGAAAIPTPTYPINNAIIPVNSLSGNTNPFNFMWTVPSAAAPNGPPATTYGYSFNVRVYLDAAGTIPYAGSNTVKVAAGSYTTGVVSQDLNSAGGGTAFAGTPGITYYWRVRSASGAPELGAWSAMMSFNVQQLQAIVPVLSSPVNGSALPSGQAPAFSWNPIAAATSYTFQLSTDASFATTIYTTTATAAGISLPATVTPLKPGTTYFWRVSTLTPAVGEWSTVANFTVAAPVTTAAPITIPPAVTPTITVNIPAATTTVITIPPPVQTTTEVNPSYIWAIIIIGAVLVIAVIVLIVRTRRSV